MIWPGVNLPPPIASELEGGRDGLDAGRGGRWGGLAAEDGPLGVEAGAMVSPSRPGASSTSVRAAPESKDWPQFGQNFADAETGFLQEEHNIRKAILSLRLELLTPGPNHCAARSTCTAVP